MRQYVTQDAFIEYQHTSP